MNSLKDLNGFSNTAIVYQTANTGNVVISTPVNTTQMMPDYTNKFEWPVGMEVLQTGNVANVNYYTISMPVSPGLANVSQAVSWPNLPNTFTITRSGYVANTGTYDYQVKGPITTTNWNLIKSPVIQLANNYNYANTVMTANVYINAGNTASHTMTLYFPYDIITIPPGLTYQEDILSSLPSFGVSTNTDPDKIYQCTVRQDPMIGNLIIDGTSYGNLVVVTGNANVVNAALGNLQFLGNANSFANTTLYYSQKQVSNGIQQAWDQPVPLNSTGDLYDAPISGGFQVMSANGLYNGTSNVSNFTCYYNQLIYFEAIGNGKSGTGNTISNVTVAFTQGGGVNDEIYTIGNVVTVTPNAFSTGSRVQNYYALQGYFEPAPSGAPSAVDESWAATATATTTGGQVTSRSFTALKYADANAFRSSQSPSYTPIGGTGTRFGQGRKDTILYTVDLPNTQVGNTFTLSSNSNVSIDVRHYPSFGYQYKTLNIDQIVSIETESLGELNYNLSSGTFSPALNTNAQAFWDTIGIDIRLGGTIILRKNSGTSAVINATTIANITGLLSETSWGNAQQSNISLTQTISDVPSQYFTAASGNSWISVTLPIQPTAAVTTGLLGPNITPYNGYSGPERSFESYWTKL